MIEGNGHESAEAGPSRRPLEHRQSQNGLRRRRSADTPLASSFGKAGMTDESRGLFSEDPEDHGQLNWRSSRYPTNYLATPPPEEHEPDESHGTTASGSRTSEDNLDEDVAGAARPILRNAHTVHASASEFFHTPLLDYEAEADRIDMPHDHGRARTHMPPLTRQTTYSSLPPSPRYDDYQFSGTLDRRDFADAMDRLGSESGSESRRPSADDRTATKRKRDDDEGPAVVLDDDKLGANDEGEGLSLWDLLRDEVGVEDWDGWIVDGKWERIANFLAVPLAVEKVTLFGALLCLDGFLYNFTILPIRSLFATSRIVVNALQRRAIWPIPPTHLLSILRMLLLFVPTVVLLFATDASKMYHTVRGQDTIKLYVIFNALEIADRLCCAFGQDVLDTLFARETLVPSPSSRKVGRGRKRQQARPFFFFVLSLGYVLVHTLIYFYMLVSLNVAINSYDYTLLSLLISNQFVEIKGSVFKKFEKENLFQIMCADIVERFQLALMLCVIALRNMIEMAGSEIAFLPKSFIRGKSLLDATLSPVLFVIVSEMIVDWLKHAFITKFNHVRASVYGRFADVLAKDVLLAGSMTTRHSRSKGRNHPILLDQSPLVARRLGFASIPLACLVIRISVQAIGMLTASSHHNDSAPGLDASRIAWIALKWSAGIGIGLSAWGCLVAFKILLGLSLLSYSALRQAGMAEREAEDQVNDFGRAAVGEREEEAAYNKQTSRYLSKDEDDLPDYTSPAVTRPHTPAGQSAVPAVAAAAAAEMGVKGAKGKGKKWKLEEVERWTMVKRIW